MLKAFWKEVLLRCKMRIRMQNAKKLGCIGKCRVGLGVHQGGYRPPPDCVLLGALRINTFSTLKYTPKFVVFF